MLPTGGNIDKELVKKRFQRSLPYYDRIAEVQRMIAKNLSDKFAEAYSVCHGNIFEIGCGTGFLTTEILKKQSFKNFFINDLVPEAMDIVSEKIRRLDSGINVKCVNGDAENIDIPEDIDSLLAASVVQWFDDFVEFSARVSKVLPNDGIFAFNTFGTNNLCQIKELTGMGLNYFEADELNEILKRNFRNVELSEDIISQTFDAPFDVLRHLQRTGVTATGDFKWTKSRLEKFEREYSRNYSVNGKIELTWHVIYAICKK